LAVRRTSSAARVVFAHAGHAADDGDARLVEGIRVGGEFFLTADEEVAVRGAQGWGRRGNRVALHVGDLQVARDLAGDDHVAADLVPADLITAYGVAANDAAVHIAADMDL
jgi:hypothetical protein